MKSWPAIAQAGMNDMDANLGLWINAADKHDLHLKILFNNRWTCFQSERSDDLKDERLFWCSQHTCLWMLLQFAGASKITCYRIKKKQNIFFLQHLGRVNSWLCLRIQKGHDLIFSHFERAIVCVLCVWNWMASPFREQQRGNDLYSPAVSERSWGGAEKESKRGRGGGAS